MRECNQKNIMEQMTHLIKIKLNTKYQFLGSKHNNSRMRHSPLWMNHKKPTIMVKT